MSSFLLFCAFSSMEPAFDRYGNPFDVRYDFKLLTMHFLCICTVSDHTHNNRNHNGTVFEQTLLGNLPMFRTFASSLPFPSYLLYCICTFISTIHSPTPNQGSPSAADPPPKIRKRCYRKRLH